MKTCLDCTHLIVGGAHDNHDWGHYMVKCDQSIWPGPFDCTTSDLLRSLARAKNCKFFVHSPGPDYDGRVGEFV